MLLAAAVSAKFIAMAFQWHFNGCILEYFMPKIVELRNFARTLQVSAKSRNCKNKHKNKNIVMLQLFVFDFNLKLFSNLTIDSYLLRVYASFLTIA